MSRTHHYLKIHPHYYLAIERREKTFEVREKKGNDFKVHDILHLLEYYPEEYSGREIVAEISYVLDDPEFCKEGLVILGIKNIISYNSVNPCRGLN